MAVNFDRVARAYRWMEYASFGPMLERCRETYLSRLTGARHALVLGDGDGRFLARLLTVNSGLTVDVVDSSRSMLRLLKRRIGNAPQVSLHQADVLAWEPSGSYDLVATHFLLDCFFPEQLQQLLDRILPHLSPGAQWVISEFAIPQNQLLAPVAAGLIALLYRFFQIFTGLPVRNLPGHSAHLIARGLTLRAEQRYLAGLISAQLWTLP